MILVWTRIDHPVAVVSRIQATLLLVIESQVRALRSLHNPGVSRCHELALRICPSFDPRLANTNPIVATLGSSEAITHFSQTLLLEEHSVPSLLSLR